MDESNFVLCTIGRLVKRKNIPETLTVLSRLRRSINFKFFIIGDGPERKTIEDTIQRFDLADSVHLLGNASDEVKFQVLNLSDAYISTALHEGFGLVFLEAMEFGLPVICYNNGGQTDFRVDGMTGFLTDVGDLESLQEKIYRIYKDKKLQTRIRHHNKMLINEFYISNCAEKYLQLFQEVIDQRNGMQPTIY